MKTILSKGIAVGGALVLLGASCVQPAFSKDPQFPSNARIDQAVEENSLSFQSVRRSTPASKSEKQVEDAYHQAEVELEQAYEDFAAAVAKKNPSKKEIAKAEEAIEKANVKVYLTHERAAKNGNSKYRKALRDLRESRSKLEKLRKDLLKDKSKAGTKKRRKIGKALRDTRPTNLIAAADSSGVSRAVAKGGARNFTLNAARGSGHVRQCNKPKLH